MIRFDRRARRALMMGVSALATLGAASAHAQQAAESQAALEEVVVTATKRETQLMTTPVAITAVTAATLEKQGISNALQLDKLVPNLKVQDQSTLGMGALQMSMRGIGNSNFTEQGDPNVGFHVDGVYMSRPQAAWNLLFDVDRVEVLRGPQGTLFGRNSTVGAINVIVSRPKLGEFSGKVEGQYGNYDDRMIRGAINIPVGDRIALRATAFAQKRDTYYDLHLDTRNGATGAQNPYLNLGDPTSKSKGAGSVDHKAVRLSALFKPVEEGSILLTYENYQSKSPAAPLTVRGHEYEAWLSTPNLTDMTIESLRGEVKYEFGGAVEAKYTYGHTDYEHEMVIDLDSGVSRYRPSTAPGTDQQYFWDRPFHTVSRSHELQLTSTYDSPVQWVLGYFNFKEDTERNLWIDLPLVADGLIDFWQPSRVAKSEAFYGTVDWDVTDQLKLKLGVRNSKDRKTDHGGSRYDAFPGDGAQARFGVPYYLTANGISDADYRSGKNTTYQGISRITGFPAAPGTAGAQIAAINGVTAAPFDRLFFNDHEWSNTDYSLTLSYEPNDKTYLYGTVATGYKSGTFQDTYFQARSYQVYTPVLDPEKLTSYEVGWKQRFDLGGGPAQVAASAFYMDYKDKQEAILVDFGDQFCPYTFGDFDGDGFVESFVPGLGGVPIFSQTIFDPVTLRNNPTQQQIASCAQPLFDTPAMQNMTELVPINLASAGIGGIEVEFSWAPTANDRFSGFVTTMLTNEVKDIDTSRLPFILTDALACGDRQAGCAPITALKGNKLPFAPKLTANLSYSHDFHLASGATITPWAQVNYSSSYFLSLWNVDCYASIAAGGAQICSNGDKQKAYATVDLSLRYAPGDKTWYAEAYGTNVTGETYATFNRRNGNDFVTGYAFNAPAFYGVRAGVYF